MLLIKMPVNFVFIQDNVVFPGGQCDGDETDREACDRELMEEVGINTK